MINFPRTPKHVLDRIYQQLALIHQTCLSNHIKYWVVSGTLLGQVRHDGHIIPWDDDGDVGIDVADMDKLKACLSPVATQHDMYVEKTTHGLKIRCKKQINIGTDIFIYKKDGPRWILASDSSRKQWPNDYFLLDELASLHLVNYSDAGQVFIPTNPMRYLTTLYGDDCMTVARLDFNHLENKKHPNANIGVPVTHIIF